MHNFIKHFRREAPGMWRCVDHATLLLPQGRIQVVAGTRFVIGTSFMGIDLAKMLDEQHAKDQKRKMQPR